MSCTTRRVCVSLPSIGEKKWKSIHICCCCCCCCWRVKSMARASWSWRRDGKRNATSTYSILPLFKNKKNRWKVSWRKKNTVVVIDRLSPLAMAEFLKLECDSDQSHPLIFHRIRSLPVSDQQLWFLNGRCPQRLGQANSNRHKHLNFKKTSYNKRKIIIKVLQTHQDRADQ